MVVLIFLLVGLVVAIGFGMQYFRDQDAALSDDCQPAEPLQSAPTRRAALTPAAKTVSAASTTIVLPALPSEFDRVVRIRGDGGASYEVNPGRLSCTCGDFATYRASLPPHDIRRICEHVGRALEDTGAVAVLDEVAQALVRTTRTSSTYGKQRRPHAVDASRFLEMRDGEDRIVLAFADGKDWVDVVTRRGTKARVKRYKRYGYNISEDRWSYGSAPFEDADIRATIVANRSG